jgi:5-amino-6-(5-phosphoribosylamino)uracil reductase
VVYLSERAPASRRKAIEATGRRMVVVPAGDETAAMLRHMRAELGARTLLCEGGPTLNGALLDGDAVDELFLTVGGVIVGGGDDSKTAIVTERPATREGLRPVELVSVAANAETGELYLRYRVRR